MRKMVSSSGPSPHMAPDGVNMDAYDFELVVTRRSMYTGDWCKGIEVSIHTGDLKGHFGTIIGSRIVDGKTLATVRTDTRAINHMVEFEVDNLRELQ
jgi:hypothetical protein